MRPDLAKATFEAGALGFSSLGPYVPAVSESGQVAFYAETAQRRAILVDGEIAFEHPRLNSHPIFWKSGVAAYCDEGLISSEGLLYEGEVGPLGPTTNGAVIAFRIGDEAWVFDGAAHKIGEFPGMTGLPLVDSKDRVTGRCEAGIVRDGVVIANLPEMGRFPALDGDLVIFAGVDEEGRRGVFSEEGPVWLDESGFFESIRGALPGLMFATPHGGALGIYRGIQRLWPISEDVVDFALNPVSMNRAGNWSVRAKYADGREAIHVW